MLLAIREKAQGWFAWAIVIFISIPFALWGIQSYLGIGGEQVAATVDGAEVTEQDIERRLRDFRDNLRSRLGKSYRPDMFDDKVLRAQVMEQMINETVLEGAAQKWNLRASDDFVRAYIRSIPAFQDDGRFDVDAYNIAVRNRGMSQRMFEESVRQELVMDQLRNGISASAFSTGRQLDELARLTDQQRDISYFQLSAERLAEDIQNSDDELKQYYDSNVSLYLVPERLKVEYLLLDLETVGKKVAAGEDALRGYYEQHRDEFQVPEERRVRHILIAVSESAADSAVEDARATVEDLSRRLDAGEDFAALAKEFSDDPGSADQGGDVGWISRGMMAAAFEASAYGLEPATLSEPVRTPFGFHLIEVTEIKSGGEGSFEVLRDKIETAYRRAEAENLFYDHAERLADLSYESPDSLLPAAEALELEVVESDWFDRSGAPGRLNSVKVVGAAFSEDVLTERNNSELIELDEEQVLVLRVVEHEAEQTQPLADVREKVDQDLTRKKSRELAESEGEKLLQSIRDGQSLQAAAQTGGWEVKQPGLVNRRDTTVPAGVTRKAFELPHPVEGKDSIAGVALPEGDYAIVAVSTVKNGDPAAMDENTREATRTRIDRQLGSSEFDMLGAFLRSNADVQVELNP